MTIGPAPMIMMVWMSTRLGMFSHYSPLPLGVEGREAKGPVDLSPDRAAARRAHRALLARRVRGDSFCPPPARTGVLAIPDRVGDRLSPRWGRWKLGHASNQAKSFRFHLIKRPRERGRDQLRQRSVRSWTGFSNGLPLS